MGIFSFIKTAGEDIAALVKTHGTQEEAIRQHVEQFGLGVQNLGVKVDGDGVTVTGATSSQEMLEKAILAVGNLKGIGSVNSLLSLASGTSAQNNEQAAPMPTAATSSPQALPSAQKTAQPQMTAQRVPVTTPAALRQAGVAVQPHFYVVKSGDTLSKIAKSFYGDANAYNRIFEANRPMLKSPDAIYPDQTLRIPDAPAKNTAAA